MDYREQMQMYQMPACMDQSMMYCNSDPMMEMHQTLMQMNRTCMEMHQMICEMHHHHMKEKRHGC